MIEFNTILVDKEPVNELQQRVMRGLEKWKANLIWQDGEWWLSTLTDHKDEMEAWARECLARFAAGDTSDFFVLDEGLPPGAAPRIKRVRRKPETALIDPDIKPLQDR